MFTVFYNPRETQEDIAISSLTGPPSQSTDSSVSSIAVDISLNQGIILCNIGLRGNGMYSP